MNLFKCYFTGSKWYKNAARGKPVGVLWHDTAACNPTLKRYVQPNETDPNYNELMAMLGKNRYNNSWQYSTADTGVNAFIGQLEDGTIATAQVGEWNIHAWGCGGGEKGSCNGYIKQNGKVTWVEPFWLQFEICDDNYQKGTGTKEYFDAVYKEACEFTAYLCKEFNIDPKGTIEFNGVTVPTILCHQDSYRLDLGNNHGDVYKWFNIYGKTMDDVRNDVYNLIHNDPPQPSDPIVAGDLVSIVDGAVYWSGKSIPKWVKAKNWYVVEVASSGRAVIDKSEDGASSIMSPIDVKYLRKVQTDVVPDPEPTPDPTPNDDEDSEDVNVFIKALRAVIAFIKKLWYSAAQPVTLKDHK